MTINLHQERSDLTALLNAYSVLSGRVMDIARSLPKEDKLRTHLENACEAARESLWEKESK